MPQHPPARAQEDAPAQRGHVSQPGTAPPEPQQHREQLVAAKPGPPERAAVVAEEAYRRFADDPDPATAAVIRHRAAFHRAFDAPNAGLPLIEEALRLHEQAPPSAGHAMARYDYVDILLNCTGRPAEGLVPYGLTGRELAVLRLLAAGCTNAQIGAELYISHKTASVHVSNILRKLGVSGRAQAAAVAERAGLLAAAGPKAGSARI